MTIGPSADTATPATAVEYGDDLVLLDCGGKFREEEQRGIDLVIPDVSYVSYVKQRRANLRAILVTHGHEDHIGALPYVIPQLKGKELLPIYGSPLALGFIHVTHSIPDTNAIAIHSPAGPIIDTADFKFDPTPIMGGRADEGRFRRLGEAGVLALFSDTVRVEVDGSTPSERIVKETMGRVIRGARGRSSSRPSPPTSAASI